MPTRFITGTQFVWNDKEYKCLKRIGENVNLLDLGTGEVHSELSVHIAHAFVAGELRIKGQRRSHDNDGQCIGWNDLPEEEKRVAEYRYAIIKPFIDLPQAGRRKAIVEFVEKQKLRNELGNSLTSALSASSIYRWLKALEEGGGVIQALIPRVKKRGNRNQTRLDPEVETIVGSVIEDHAGMELVTGIDRIHQEILAVIRDENRYRTELDKLPQDVSRSTVARRIRRKDVDGKMTQKRDRRARDKIATQVMTRNAPEWPLDRVEVDHNTLDIIVVDEHSRLPIGRPTLTLALDICTRYPLGFYTGFENASFDTIRACLIRSLLPKTGFSGRYNTMHNWVAFGVPVTLVVDNGRDYTGHDLRDACRGLGIELQFMPVRTPHYKGAIERFFRTLNTQLIHTLPGTTFSNPIERGDYESEKEAKLTLRELNDLISMYIVDSYAESFHTGLEGVPAREWERYVKLGFLQRLESRESVMLNLGRVASANLNRYGIQYKMIKYNSPDLGPLRARLAQTKSQKVKIKINPLDLGSIFVLDPYEQRYIEVPTLQPDYATALSIWEHEKARKYVLRHRDHVNLEELGDARRQIDEVVANAERETTKTLSMKDRRDVSRWAEGRRRRNLSRGTGHPEQMQILPQNAGQIPASTREDLELDMDHLEDDGWSVYDGTPVEGDDIEEQLEDMERGTN